MLKCAIKKANGMGAWCTFSPADWTIVVHPNEDEIGVFLQGSQDLPYEPRAQTSLSTSSNKVSIIVVLLALIVLQKISCIHNSRFR